MATIQQKKEATDWVDDWDNQGYGKRFHGISKGIFFPQVKERIETPRKINQSETYTCGPATFIRAIADKRPLDYAKFACSLFSFGQAEIEDFKITAPEEVLTVINGTPEMLSMKPADWVVLASIRTSKNFLLTDIGTMTGGATFAAEISYWFKQAGFQSVNKTSLVSAESWDNWQDACLRCMNGEMVCMWMHTNMFEKSTTFGPMFKTARCANRSMYPDHWVGLVNVRSIRDPVDVDLYSWKKIGPLKYTKADEANFIRHHYGFVAADPLSKP